MDGPGVVGSPKTSLNLLDILCKNMSMSVDDRRTLVKHVSSRSGTDDEFFELLRNISSASLSERADDIDKLTSLTGMELDEVMKHIRQQAADEAVMYADQERALTPSKPAASAQDPTQG